MKLATYTHQGTTLWGIIKDSQVLGLAPAWAAHRQSSGVAAGLAEFPQDLMGLLQGDGEMWQLVADIEHWAEGPAARSGESLWSPLAQVRLAPPVANPSKIICVGLNYHDHCRETGQEVPARPILFAKFPSTIIGPEDEIRWPADISQQVDFEVELAVIMGREGHDIPQDRAYEYIAGYTILNDVSARDVQFADGQWVRGKSFDTFCPLGPYLVTVDEVPDPHDLDIRCWVNGELMQDSNTRELIFQVPELVAYISKTCTLMPGDIISTGTPGGVGVFREPPVFLKPGDVVELEIEKLGLLRNRVG